MAASNRSPDPGSMEPRMDLGSPIEALLHQPEIEEATLEEIEAERRYLRRFLPLRQPAASAPTTGAADDYRSTFPTRVTNSTLFRGSGTSR